MSNIYFLRVSITIIYMVFKNFIRTCLQFFWQLHSGFSAGVCFFLPISFDQPIFLLFRLLMMYGLSLAGISFSQLSLLFLYLLLTRTSVLMPLWRNRVFILVAKRMRSLISKYFSLMLCSIHSLVQPYVAIPFIFYLFFGIKLINSGLFLYSVRCI